MSTGTLSPAPPGYLRTMWGRLRAGTVGNLVRAVRGNRKATVGTVLLAVFVFLAFFPGLIAHDNPSAEIYSSGTGPSGAHLLGTTTYGQDIFAQLIYSTRESLIIALVAGALSTMVGIAMGVTAAYVGGLVDDALSVLTDIFLVIPTFPLIVVIAAYSKNGGDSVLIAVLVITGWSYGARQFRVQALSMRDRDFLVAARLRGERRWRVISSEILPTMTSLIVAVFLSNTLYSIITAAGLQFIGLGNTSANVWSWGTMLYWAQNNEALQAGSPLWAIMPGVAIALLGSAFALLNYAFDEISNPALRPVPALGRRRGLIGLVMGLRHPRGPEAVPPGPAQRGTGA
jgi:peptide/nickel transport system permease protein